MSNQHYDEWLLTRTKVQLLSMRIGEALEELDELVRSGDKEAVSLRNSLAIHFMEEVHEIDERTKRPPDPWVLEKRTKADHFLEIAKMLIMLFSGNPDPDHVRGLRYQKNPPRYPTKSEIKTLGEFRRGHNDKLWDKNWEPAMRLYLKRNIDSLVNWEAEEVQSIVRRFKTKAMRHNKVMDLILQKCRGIFPK